MIAAMVAAAALAPAQNTTVAFVPLSSIKKSGQQ